MTQREPVRLNSGTLVRTVHLMNLSAEGRMSPWLWWQPSSHCKERNCLGRGLQQRAKGEQKETVKPSPTGIV